MQQQNLVCFDETATGGVRGVVIVEIHNLVMVGVYCCLLCRLHAISLTCILSPTINRVDTLLHVTAGVYSKCVWEYKKNALGKVIKPLETSKKIDKVMVKILGEKC